MRTFSHQHVGDHAYFSSCVITIPRPGSSHRMVYILLIVNIHNGSRLRGVRIGLHSVTPRSVNHSNMMDEYFISVALWDYEVEKKKKKGCPKGMEKVEVMLPFSDKPLTLSLGDEVCIPIDDIDGDRESVNSFAGTVRWLGTIGGKENFAGIETVSHTLRL